jgi:hypothetical protein
MNVDPAQHARHNLRGRINALKLCVTAFEVLQTPQECLEFLDMIDQAADKTIVSLDELEALYDRFGPPTPAAART